MSSAVASQSYRSAHFESVVQIQILRDGDTGEKSKETLLFSFYLLKVSNLYLIAGQYILAQSAKRMLGVSNAVWFG